MGDTALTAKVKAALIAEPGLKSTLIDVSTKQSVVTLSGAVASPVEKAKALQVADNVEGVKSVVDNLVAKS
jgi:hyperosmotically inducible protein